MVGLGFFGLNENRITASLVDSTCRDAAAIWSILGITGTSVSISIYERSTFHEKWASHLEGPEKVASVSIPTTLFKKLQDRIKGTGFDSVSDYVTYLLQEVMAELEMTTPQEHFSKDDEERVKERLRSLGYLG